MAENNNWGNSSSSQHPNNSYDSQSNMQNFAYSSTFSNSIHPSNFQNSPSIFQNPQIPTLNFQNPPLYFPNAPNFQNPFLNFQNPPPNSSFPFPTYPTLNYFNSVGGSHNVPGYHNSDAGQTPTPGTSISDTQSPAFSTQPAIDGITISDEDVDEANERSTKWKMEEDVTLAKSWLTISTNSIVGNSQNRDAFWERITEYYNTNRASGQKRRAKQCKTHWHYVNGRVNDFNQHYNRLRSLHRSGWNEDQLKQEARKIYHQEKNHHFIYEHVWVVVKDDPKWKAIQDVQRPSKKTRTSESGGYTSSSHTDGGIDLNNFEPEVRPMGQKAAKRKGKARVGEKSSVPGNDKIVNLLEENTGVLNHFHTSWEDAMIVEYHKILMMDTTEMDEEKLADHRITCAIIRKKLASLV